MTTPSTTSDADPARKIRCRWCKAAFLPWRTTKDGRRVSGWPRLKDHIAEYHPDEFGDMHDALGPDENEDYEDDAP